MRLGKHDPVTPVVALVMWVFCALQAPGPVLCASAVFLPLYWLVRWRERTP